MSGAERLGNQALGVLFLVVFCLMAWLTVAIYDKTFVSTVDITLRTDRVGNQLKKNADVKVRGVVVGTVSSVRTTGTDVDVTLALAPEHVDQLPRNMSARLLPKTLFGQRYVSLILPDHPDGRAIGGGDLIEQDMSKRAIELEQALRDLLPLLQAVQPQKLSATLGAIAQALEGRGEPLGETLVSMDAYLEQLNQKMPQIQQDITGFADTLATYEQAGPDILDALSDLTTTSKTIEAQRTNLATLFDTLTTATTDLDGFLRQNKENIIGLSVNSRPTLELLARYSSEFPCLAEAAAALKPLMDETLGAGTGEPGIHIELTTKPPDGPGPVPPPGSGPRCYPSGVSNLVNSPEESELIAELLAPSLDVSPAKVPSWSGLLVGPVLRGTEVTIS